MNDVIFQGGENKNSLNLAEVNLSFDNKDKSLDLAYDKVIISRRIYRDGENEYKINGKKVRLKDIRELFLDTGIGKEGYSLIGQGRIDEIINSSNRERRALFEEASGISKHKYRRDEASKKLTRVSDDLEIIEREWDYKYRDIKKLKIESENYNKYINRVKELDFKSYHYLKNKSEVITNKISDLNKEKDSILDKLKQSEKIQNNLSNKLKPLTIELEKIDNDIKSYQTKIDETDKQIEAAKVKIDLNEQKSTYSKKDLDRSSENIKVYENRLSTNEKAYKEESKRLEDIKTRRLATRKDLTSLKTKLEELNNNKEELVEKIQSLSSKKKDLDKQIQDYEINQRSEQLYELRRKEELEANKKKLDSLNTEIGKVKEILDDLHSNKVNILKKNEDLSKLINDKETNLESINNDLEDYRAKLNQININLKTAINQYKFNKEAYDKNEGYFYSVSDFLNKSKNEGLDSLYIDTLANLIKVKPGYEEVIDNLIGPGLQNIVTRNKNETRDLINFVNKNRIGRVTFLPMDSVKGFKKDRVKNPQVIAMAYDLIKYDERLSSIIYHFLGSTIVTENIDDAVALSNEISGYRIITMNLDVINSWGSMVAGSNKKSKSHAGILNRTSKLNQNKVEVTKLRAKYKDLDQSIKDLNTKEDLLQIELKKLREEYDKSSKDHIDISNKISNLSYKLENFNNQKDEILEKVGYKSNDNESIDIDKLRAEESDLSNKIEVLINEKENILSTIGEVTSDISKSENSLELLNRDLNMVHNSTLKLADDMKNIKESLKIEKELEKEASSTLKSVKEENEDLKADIEKYSEVSKNNKIKKEEAINLRKEKEDTNQKLLKDAKALEEELQALNLKKVEMTYKLDSLNSEYNNLIDEVSPFLSKSIDQLEKEIDLEKDLKVNKTDLINLQKSINNIGYFTENSVEEYNKANEEFELISSQLDDLKDSKKNIEEMIISLESQMKDEFKKNFKIINDKFALIFETLFMGGEAKLSLDDKDELTAGVDIIARPPSKSLKSISLLSGGEKALTAVALLFAIFETNPAPFAILDEIDAALDETNIRRYIEYIKTLSENSQFIMITHRQTTMQLAEEIYGVTIGDDGISKIYSMDFE